MKELYLTEEKNGISASQLDDMIDRMLAQFPDIKKVLIIPPDYTRCYSYAGIITQVIYKKIEKMNKDVPRTSTSTPTSCRRSAHICR